MPVKTENTLFLETKNRRLYEPIRNNKLTQIKKDFILRYQESRVISLRLRHRTRSLVSHTGDGSTHNPKNEIPQ